MENKERKRGETGRENNRARPLSCKFACSFLFCVPKRVCEGT